MLRLFTIFYLFGILCFVSFGSAAQTRTTNASMVSLATNDLRVSQADKEISLSSTLKEIQSRFNVSILYDSELIKNKKVTEIRNYKTIEETLNSLLAPLDLDFRKGEEGLYLIVPKKYEQKNSKPSDSDVFNSQGEAHQTSSLNRLEYFVNLANFQKNVDVSITGKVTALLTNEGLPGVTVQLKGTTVGTVTDAEGKYSIQLPDANGTLLFSYIGYQSEEVVIGGRTVIDVSMAEDLESLQEVVVVGYGKQSRKNLTSAINTIKPEEMNRGAISDVGQLLQGKVPGLNITKSGDPNRAASIILRGASTLREGAQSPLFVIDGVIGADISVIAPDDIASMDVLKDAAATAIYGNRGANGVIMVTTKRAEKGQTRVSYSGYVGFDKVSNQYDMMDANQLKAFLEQNGQSLAPADDLGFNTNWQSEVQRKTAVTHNHNISLGGGTDKTIYSASLNYFNQEGIIKGSNLERFIGRLSIEQKTLRDKLKLGVSLNSSLNDADLVPYRNTVLSQMLTYMPTSPVRNADNTYFENLTKTSYYNPVAMLENGQERNKYQNLLGTVTAELKLPFGLTYNANLSYQLFQTNYGAYYNDYFTRNYNNVRSTPDPPGNPVFINLTGRNGLATRNAYQSTNKILETFLTWDRQFDKHGVNVVLGYSWQENINNDGFQATSTNFPSNEAGYNNMGLGNPYAVPAFRVNYGGTNFEQVRLISDFGRLNYNYDSRYLIQVSVRRDGSSTFGVDNQWGIFPSVGAAWRISNEGFMKDLNIFDDLKLRASYGVTGNSAGFNPYTTRLIYGTVGTFYYKGTQENAIGVLQNENPKLNWEKTATANLGLDFAVLKGRLGGSVEVYNKTTTDLIFNYEVSTSIYPAPTLLANVGEMSNKGIEFVLNAVPVQTSNFSWNTTLNLAHNKNKIVSLSGPGFVKDSVRIFTPDGPGQTGETIQALIQGQPLGTFFTYKYAGKNENGVSQYVGQNGEPTTTPQVRRDYQAVGNAQPKLMLGWSNNVRYKNFDLNLFFRSVLGSKIMNVTGADLNNPNTARLTNVPVSVGSESVNDVNASKYSSRFVESGDFLRLDNATLGYSFKNVLPDVSMIRLYVSTNNLFIITKYSGIDPEINQGGLAPGIDARNFYPKTRTIMVGISASF